MKFLITIVILVLSICVPAQDFYSEFLNACEQNDIIKQTQVLEKWELTDPSDPELYTSRF